MSGHVSNQIDFLSVLFQWPLLLKGLLVTIFLTAASSVLGLSIGVACAWARSDGPAPIKGVVVLYVELIRNTPFIVQLFFVFFGLPSLGLKFSPEAASVIAMFVNLGAYTTEIVRAGLKATPAGQIEAAVSLGLNRWQVFIYIVLRPALKRMWPAIVSQIIIVMLGSAVCSLISIEELSYAASLIQCRSFRAFEAFIVATLMYLALAIALRRLLNWVGSRLIFGWI
jgi:polar amino acid transport system permease protein